MNLFTRWICLGATVLLSGSLFAEKITKHVVDGWEDWYWTKKVTVQRGQEHTFWVTGLTPDTYITDVEVYCEYTYKEEGEVYEDSVWASESCERENSSGGWDRYVLLTADDWEWVPSSKSSLTFTVKVSGWEPDEGYSTADISFTFGHADGSGSYPGEQEPIYEAPMGSADKPQVVVLKETTSPATSAMMVDCVLGDDLGDTYYIKTSPLTAGHKYFFGIDNNSDMSISSTLGGANLFLDESCSKPYEGFASCVEAYSFVAPASGPYWITVKVESDFTFYHAALPVWTPVQHASSPIGVGAVSEPFAPGYLNDPNGTSYDAIIDQQLFAVTNCVKGTSYLFKTEGANADLLMRVYDAKGNVLAENYRIGDSSLEVQCAWTAPSNYAAKNNAIYVGVCQVLADGEEPSAGEVTLAIEEVKPENTQETLTVTPSGMTTLPSAENALSATCWTNTFAIAARAGVTYHIKTVASDAAADGRALDCRVYTLNGTKATELTATKGGLNGNIDWKGEGVEFTPEAHGTIYVDVFVANGDWGRGMALAYGPYTVVATTAAGDYGILTVDMKGASQSLMGWKLLKKDGVALSKPAEVVYPAGASTILAAGQYVVMAQSVADFVKPDATAGFTNITVVANQQVTASYKYTDSKDPGDDAPTGTYGANKKYAPDKLAPSVKGVTVSRSLWADDSADWFKFTATEGTYYKFQFTEKTGAPKMWVYGPVNWTNECAYVLDHDQMNCVQVCATAKGDYYLKIAHEDEKNPTDSAYTLFTMSANPGAIKLGKSAVSVKEDAAYVEVDVTRSAKDGNVRLKYRTEAVTAQPGTEYFPTNGVIEWAANDSTKKVVRVYLIPDLVAKFEENKTFKIVFETFTEQDKLAENEYIPSFAVDTKTKLPVDTCVVTLTETAKAVPGTIVAVGAIDAKKPVYSVTAGESITIPFARTVGTDGVVGVKVETVKGKEANAKGETDFTPVAADLIWLDGESDDKSITIDTKSVADDYTATKAFTLKLTALTSAKTDKVQYARPTLSASTVTINIVNDKFANSMADYSKTVTAAANGYTLKEGKAGTWVVNADGSFSAPNKGDLTITFATSGTFTYTVDDDRKTFTADAKNKTLTIKGASSVTIDDYVLDGEPVALRQGVKYTASFGSEGVVKATNLPRGLKLAQDKTTKTWTVDGVPSKAGIFQVVYTTTVGKVATTETICYTVTAEGTAAGTYTGLAMTYDTTNALPALAQVSITAALGGKLSAKVNMGGKSYSFADTGYVSYVGGFDDESDPAMLTAELIQVQKVTTADKKSLTLTNYLYYTVYDVPETIASGWYREGLVDIRMAALPDVKGAGYQEDVWYEGKIYRDNAKVAAWVAEAAKYAGYYTIALVNADAQMGEPRGNGYVTLTLDAKGKAKVTGVLPDGTAVSGSATVALVDTGVGVSVRVPLYLCKNPNVFGGWLALALNENGVVVATLDAPETDLIWKNDNPASTHDGEDGFSLQLYPVGGYYDTVMNLRRYYLESELVVSLANGEDDLEELSAILPEGYEFVATPEGQPLTLDGSKDSGTLTVDKQKLVKDDAKLTDFANSVNASNVAISFKRATGILTGTFDLWYQGANAKGVTEQKSLAKLKYGSILILNAEDDGYVDEDTVFTGYYLVPMEFSELDAKGKTVKRKYNGSYRFDVKAVDCPYDWTEVKP